jgi:hypothetical protein
MLGYYEVVTPAPVSLFRQDIFIVRNILTSSIGHAFEPLLLPILPHKLTAELEIILAS